ncbi:MAG TPA: PAS domain-containing protein, partial [Humisphaera sp.]|nr:PAS domain-containing protein [Humisphaera sp.]
METDRDLQIDGLWPLLERSFEGVVLLAPAPWQVARANTVAAECLGAAEQELIGRRAVELFDDASRKAAMELVQRAWVGDSDVEPILATLVSDSGASQRV